MHFFRNFLALNEKEIFRPTKQMMRLVGDLLMCDHGTLYSRQQVDCPRKQMEQDASSEHKEKEEEQQSTAMRKLSRALFSRGKYENPWATWQARTPIDALKWAMSRKTPPLPSREELDRVSQLIYFNLN